MVIVSEIGLLICLSGVIPFGIYMLYRNNKVYQYRTKILTRCRVKGSFKEYNQLPEYNTMWLKFWKWPMKSFNNYEQIKKEIYQSVVSRDVQPSTRKK